MTSIYCDVTFVKGICNVEFDRKDIMMNKLMVRVIIMLNRVLLHDGKDALQCDSGCYILLSNVVL